VELQGDPRPQSRLAVISFVLGLVAFVPPAVVCGVLALRRINRGRLRGRGFAIAGLVLPAAWTVLIAGLVVFATSTDAERDPSGRIVAGGSLSVFDVRDGDCLNGVEEVDATFTVGAVACTEPHDAQADRFPPEAGRDAEPFFVHPTRPSWETRDDRTVTCLALFKQRRSGSLE